MTQNTFATHASRAFAGLGIAATLVGAAWAGSAIAHADQGMIQEDEPGWSCVDDGNRICGPGNAEGKLAACYDEGGVIVALWPCYVVVNAKGDGDIYEGTPGVWSWGDDAAYDRGYEN